MSSHPKARVSASDADGRGGMLRKALRRLTSSNAELADRDRRRTAEEAGATAISDCADRQKVVLCGEVTSVTVNGSESTPALECELRDGTGSVTLIWLGRRKIPGIDAGREIRVTGRICRGQDGSRMVFNPMYELH